MLIYFLLFPSLSLAWLLRHFTNAHRQFSPLRKEEEFKTYQCSAHKINSGNLKASGSGAGSILGKDLYLEDRPGQAVRDLQSDLQTDIARITLHKRKIIHGSLHQVPSLIMSYGDLLQN